MKHQAEILPAKADEPKILKVEFEVVNGELSFTCHTQNVSFEEVLNGITLLRDECQRQIDNKEKCPFHTKAKAISDIPLKGKTDDYEGPKV